MNEALETPESQANRRLKTVIVVLSLVTVLAIAAALYLYGQKKILENDLNTATMQRDSLNKVVIEQTNLLEAEGNQFQQDLLKIDSLQNQK